MKPDIDVSDWSMFESIDFPNPMPVVPCVYFLMFDNELVYIGQTNNLKRRIYVHDNNMNANTFEGNKRIGNDFFNKVLYRIVGERLTRKYIEKIYSDAFEPKLCSCGIYSHAFIHGKYSDYIKFRLKFGLEERYEL